MTTTKIKQISNEDIFLADFKNSLGSRKMNVNGSVTPMIFDLMEDANSYPVPVEKINLTTVDFIISCGSGVDLTSFGGLSVALTNGIKFEIDGIKVFKDNADILLFASDSTVSSGKVEGQEVGFINGHWDTVKTFQNGLVCNVADLKIIIQDDLTNIKEFRVCASGTKIY